MLLGIFSSQEEKVDWKLSAGFTSKFRGVRNVQKKS